MGDYDIKILTYDTHAATVEFVDMLYSHAFLPLINRPTRITQNSTTIIDNITYPRKTSVECGQNGIFVTEKSDNFPLFHIGKNTQIAQTGDTYISSRNYSHVTKFSFQQAVTEIDWFEMHMLSDTRSAFSLFYSSFITLFDKHFPQQKIKIQYKSRKPWLTPAFIQSIRINNKLYHELIAIGFSYYECQYEMYRNKLQYSSKCAEKDILLIYGSQTNKAQRIPETSRNT